MRPDPPLITGDADHHVEALLDWLQGDGGRTGEILAGEMVLIYGEMCSEIWLAPRPWRSVAAALRKHLGGKKKYRQWRNEAGERHRTVVWLIP